MRVSATAPSSTLVSIWTPASMSTTRSTAPQRPRAACWGPSLGPRSLGCGQEMATATWGNCFPRRWEGSEAGPEQSPRLWKCWHVFLCSGSAAISDTWTCQSWGSLPLWWLTHLGTSTWSCPTELWLMMRWESWTSPFCKMMDSSFFGLLAGNSSFRFEEAWSLLTFVSCIIFIFWSAGQCVFFFLVFIHCFAHLLPWQGDGAGPRVSQSLGVSFSTDALAPTKPTVISFALFWPCCLFQIRASWRDHLGENQPASENHPHRKDGPLAEPREGALSGGIWFCCFCQTNVTLSPWLDSFPFRLVWRATPRASTEVWTAMWL